MANVFESLPAVVPDGVIGAQVLQYMVTSRQFVLWKLEEVNGRNTKVPYQVNGYHASSTNPNTWASLKEVLEAFHRGGYNGIGYVFRKEDPLVFIDIDHCYDKFGIRSAVANEFVQALGIGPEVYREMSQSGEGLHFIVWGRIPEPIRDGKRVNGSYKNSALGIEIYDSARYVALTGNVF